MKNSKASRVASLVALATALSAAWIASTLSGCEKAAPTAPSTATQARAIAGTDCRGRADCPAGLFCLGPGEFAGCGTCFVSDPCSTDADCAQFGATYICGRPPCACNSTCVAGCTADDQCRVGEQCGADYRCAPQACRIDADCPSNFACGANGCARQACSANADCNGYCVNNLCYDALGTCTQRPVGASGQKEPPHWVQTCGPPVCIGPAELQAQTNGVDCPTPGDPCDTIDDTCGDMTSCGGYLRCASADTPIYPWTCPISSERFKAGVSYLDESELKEVARELQAIRLASYEYKQDKGKKHLGFIIEDNPQSRAVVPERDMVDLYGYTSMVVASMQVQAKEMAALKAELAALKGELEKTKKAGCRAKR